MIFYLWYNTIMGISPFCSPSNDIYVLNLVCTTNHSLLDNLFASPHCGNPRIFNYFRFWNFCSRNWLVTNILTSWFIDIQAITANVSTSSEFSRSNFNCFYYIHLDSFISVSVSEYLILAFYMFFVSGWYS